MRGYHRLAAIAGMAALSMGALTNPITSRFAALGPIILGGGGGETEEDRRRRNLAAGGRDKRIKRNKARRSIRLSRRSRTPRSARLSNPFIKEARKAEFDAMLKLGWSRNMAAKFARRVAA